MVAISFEYYYSIASKYELKI